MEKETHHLVHKIGPKLRSLRKHQNIRLLELAELSGISSAMISKVENGRIIPTIPRLLSLVSALGVSPGEFFTEINEEGYFDEYILIRRSDYQKYIKEEDAKGFTYESIIEQSIDGYAFQISLITLMPGNTRPAVTTAAYEYLYVIEGKMEYHLGGDMMILESGDSLFFDGTLPHVPFNKENFETTYIVVYFFTDKLEKKEISL